MALCAVAAAGGGRGADAGRGAAAGAGAADELQTWRQQRRPPLPACPSHERCP